jgi:FMN phosphatase YigB (HAD superfamily)
MRRAILFDVDGVLIRLPRYHSRLLEEEGYAGAAAKMDAFYGSNEQFTTGRADPLAAIGPILHELGWEGGPEAFFRAQFEYESRFLDRDLLATVGRLRDGGIRCYLATDQSLLRMRYLLKDLGFAGIFDGWFVSCEIGFRKIDEDFWERTLEILAAEFEGISSAEVLFIDDREENLRMAGTFGLECFLVAGESSMAELRLLLHDISLTSRNEFPKLE